MVFGESWLFCIQHLPCLVTIWCTLGRSCGGLGKKTVHIGSFRVKLILPCQEVLEWVWPSMNQNRLLFTQIQTLPPSMHHKQEERKHWRCIQNNQWETNSRRKLPLNIMILALRKHVLKPLHLPLDTLPQKQMTSKLTRLRESCTMTDRHKEHSIYFELHPEMCMGES